MTRKKAIGKVIASTLKALLILAFCTLASLALTSFGVGKESIIMVFLLGVLFVTVLTNGYLYGLAASAASVILFNFFFTEPRFTLIIRSAVDIMLLLFFFITAIITGTITSRLQKQMSISHRNELTARLLYEVAEGFLHVTGKRNIILRGIKYVHDNTGLSSLITLDGDEQRYHAEDYAPSGGEGFSIPIQGVTKQIGSITLPCAREDLTFQQELVAKAVAAQLGAALAREYNYIEREEIRVAMERERLRGTLLRSVAHDLRTPLTALTGASALLADNFDRIPRDEQKRLASDISEEMIWLANLVENILNMTRIGEGQLMLHKEDEVVDDVVHEALSHMARILQNRRLSVSLPEQVISLPMDGKLIVQVLTNLLDNAVKHTKTGGSISLAVRGSGNEAVFEVSDDGEGISEDVRDTLFDRFVTSSSRVVDGKRGMGFGLAICKAVVEGHGGRIWAENRPEGGARIAFTVPMEVGGDG